MKWSKASPRKFPRSSSSPPLRNNLAPRATLPASACSILPATTIWKPLLRKAGIIRNGRTRRSDRQTGGTHIHRLGNNQERVHPICTINIPPRNLLTHLSVPNSPNIYSIALDPAESCFAIPAKPSRASPSASPFFTHSINLIEGSSSFEQKIEWLVDWLSEHREKKSCSSAKPAPSSKKFTKPSRNKLISISANFTKD